MRILFLVDNLSPYRIDFFNELSKYCKLTVLYERERTKTRNEKWWEDSEINFNVKKLNTIKIGKEKVFSPQIISFLKKNLFDIIVVGAYSTLTGMLMIQYLRIKKIPFIISCDGGIIKNDKKIKYKIKHHFISSANEWLSTGIYTNKYLEHYGANPEKIYIYHFTSLRKKEILDKKISKEEKEKLKNELNLKEKNIIIGVGRFIPKKGFDILIKSAKYIRKENTGIYIIGEEPNKEYVDLKQKVEADNVYFIGFKKKEELKKYYKASDIFVLPTREDIWGLVINEAFSYGLPVITTENCIAGKELIENEKNGYIVPINNEKILANKINQIIERRELRNIMSLNNIEKIQNYTIENMVNEHIEIFKDIIKKRNKK